MNIEHFSLGLEAGAARFRALGILWLSALALNAVSLVAQQNVSGRVSGGFQAPSSTDTEGRRHVVKGKDMEPRGKDLMELTEPRVTRFNPDDTADMFIESPRCFYQSKMGLAYSATNLTVKTADGRFAIEGVGWKWDLSGSVLTISNQVLALVQKAAFAGNTNSTARGSTNNIRISSTRFQQDGDNASFFDSVVVHDGEDTVRCERLNIQFVKPGGAQKAEALQNVEIDQGDTKIRSGQAIYDLKSNIVQILEHPTWVSNQRDGSADLLVLYRAQDTLSATGNVYMKLPLTNLVLSSDSTQTNAPGTNRLVEIRSEKFYYENARSNRLANALYTGSVRATQEDSILTCVQLAADFGASNRLSHLHALEDVQMISAKSRVFGKEADYNLDSDVMKVEGEPRWEMDQTKGRSEFLLFHPKTREMFASNHVEVLVPNRSVGGFFSVQPQTNQVPRTNATPLRITAETLNRATNISIFKKDVLVADDRGTINCAMLTIFSGATNQTERILAEQEVVIRQPDLVAFGDRAEYEQSTDLVRLTGNPVLITPDKRLHADEFIIDRGRNTFSVSPGKYKIQIELGKP